MIIGWTLADQQPAQTEFVTQVIGGVATVGLSDLPPDARGRLSVLHRAFQRFDPFLAIAPSAEATNRIRLEAVLRRCRGYAQLSIDLRTATDAGVETGSSGCAYLQARRGARLRADAACQVAVETLRSLASLRGALDRRIVRTPTGARAHFLVPRSNVGRLKSALADAARTAKTGAGPMVITGPWPPSAAVWAAGGDGD